MFKVNFVSKYSSTVSRSIRLEPNFQSRFFFRQFRISQPEKVSFSFFLGFDMCFGLGDSRPHPPRRINYGADHDRYLRDYNCYERENEKYLKRKNRRHRNNNNAATMGGIAAMSAGATAGGGGGC